MKCLKHKAGNVVVKRRTNADAAKLVATGMYEYASKELWKSEVRDRSKKKK